MTNHEIKIELPKHNELEKLIQSSYDNGRIKQSNKSFIIIDKADDINWIIFKGLDKSPVRITNSELIDGSMRFIVDESNGDIRLYPISIYCIPENNKYIFY